MNRAWPEEAAAFGESVRLTLRRLGAVEFARQVEADPTLRRSSLQPALEQLGLPEIDVFENAPDALAAAVAAQAAGAVSAPWPLAAQLAAPIATREVATAVYLIADRPARLEHLDLFERPVAIDLRTGQVWRPVTTTELRPMPLDPFGVPCEIVDEVLGVDAEHWQRAIDAHIVLTAFYVLGALETAVAVAGVYAGERHQFGQQIAKFGAIQWRLSDMVLAKDGLSELSRFTLARFCERSVTPADTLGLRLATLEAAHVVLANAHQVFGAIGLCEEHDLTVIDRHLQPLLRRPAGVAATSELLRAAVAEYGFDGLFQIRAVGRRAASA
jgi:acyl-CoA dehydrogenase